MFFVIGRNIGAQHSQECFLNDVVRIGWIADDAIDIRAQRA